MRLPLHIVITTHSQFGREQNVLLFYSLFIIEFTYCMYIIVNEKQNFAKFFIVMRAKKVVDNYLDGTKTLNIS